MSFLDEILGMGGQPINPRTSPYFGPQDMGSGSGTLGSGTPQGWMAGLTSLPGAESWFTPGYGTQDATFNRDAFFDFIDRNGYQLIEQPIGGNRVRRTVVNSLGQVVLQPQEVDQNDQAFWNAGMAAMALTGANIGAAGGFGGFGSSAPSIGGSNLGLAGGGFMDASTFSGLGSSGAAGFSLPSVNSLAPAAGAGSGGFNKLLEGLGAGLDIFGGIYGMRQAEKAAERMDPFAPHRAKYAQLLSELEANPGSIVNRPGFKAGLRALESSTAAGGYFGSGNAAAALTEFGGSFFDRERALLASLAGGNVQPGAGSLGALDATGRSMASIGYGIGRLGELLGG